MAVASNRWSTIDWGAMDDEGRGARKMNKKNFFLEIIPKNKKLLFSNSYFCSKSSLWLLFYFSE